MPRPITRKAHNKCADCGTSMKEVIYIRPFAKLCDDCKIGYSQAHSEVKKIYRSFKKKPTTPAPEELVFHDDPRAEKEDNNVFYKSNHATRFHMQSTMGDMSEYKM